MSSLTSTIPDAWANRRLPRHMLTRVLEQKLNLSSLRIQIRGCLQKWAVVPNTYRIGMATSKRTAEDVQLQAMAKRLCSTPQLLFRYPDTLQGVFIKRYKRFLAEVRITGSSGREEVVVAHCPNTGPMLGLLDTPLPKCVLSRSDNPKRKCKFTLELMQAPEDGVMVGVHSAKANVFVAKMLELNLVEGLGVYTEIKSEVVYGKDKKSRCDFVLVGPLGERTYVEVKSVTYAQPYDGARIGLFPDTVSVRAQKHVKELMRVVEESQGSAACLFVVQRNDCSAFAASFSNDPEYSRLLAAARDLGVKIIAVAIDFVERENGWDVLFTGHLKVDLDFREAV